MVEPTPRTSAPGAEEHEDDDDEAVMMPVIQDKAGDELAVIEDEIIQICESDDELDGLFDSEDPALRKLLQVVVVVVDEY